MSGPTPLTLAAIEKAILDRLKSKLTGVGIDAFPDKPENYRMRDPRGEVLVVFGRSRYSMPKDVGLMLQERDLEWDITLLLRDLRTHQGAYPFLDSVRIALAGWQYPGSRKMRPIREAFVDQKDGVWNFMMTFAHVVPAIEVPDDEQEVLLRQISAIAATDYFDVEVPTG